MRGIGAILLLAALLPSLALARADPRGSATLAPGQYLYQPLDVYTGMNVTFQVSSNATVSVYLMTPSQFSQFSSTGSSTYVYSASGERVQGDVGPLSRGTYYLVVYYGASTGEAYVLYEASTVPVNVYEEYSSLPAPVGIADYGVINCSGVLRPYSLAYREAIGAATIYSIGAYNSSPPSGVSPYGASLQLNVVLQVNATGGEYVYWLQDIAVFLTNNRTMYFSDNVWNMTSSPSLLSNESVSGEGAVYEWNGDYYYAYSTQETSYSTPLNLQLAIAYARTPGGVVAMFGSSVAGEPIDWYDNVTIRAAGTTSAYLLVSGYNETPSGNYYDSELVFAGEGNGEATLFTSMNATLFLKYVLVNGSEVYPPALYGFGSDTAESADDLSTTLIGGYPWVLLGNGSFGSLWCRSSAPAFRAEANASAPEVDAGMRIPINLSSSTAGGVAPYTYYFYLNGDLVYNFTTYEPLYRGTVYLPPTEAGHYVLLVKVVDALGESANLAELELTVNPDPTASIIPSRSFTDVGIPVTLGAQVNGGTPPFTYTWYVDGQPAGVSSSYSLDPPSPGNYSVCLSVRDSAGYVVNSSPITVAVSPDPSICLHVRALSSGFLYLNDEANASACVQGGTPPYRYVWYLNGVPVAGTTSPSYFYSLSRLGPNVLQVEVVDSLGYVAVSGESEVLTTYNYPGIALVAAAVAAACVACFLRRWRGDR